MKRFKWAVTYLISLGLVLAALTNVLWAKNEKGKKEEVAPKVNITSPQNGATVSGNSLPVVVNFGPKEHGLGNVQTLKLKLDGKLVAMHDNPANVKEGTYTFTLDISNLTSGNHTLQALAYLAAEQGGHEGTSEVITFAFGVPSGDVNEEILKLEEAFTAGSWEDLTQAAATLMEIGKPAVPKLLIAFKDSSKNEVVRKMYAEILGEIKDGSAVGPLVKTLNNLGETEFIRAEAAWTLGKIGNESALNPLLNVLDDESEQVRSSAAISLGLLENSDAVMPLIKKLADESLTMRIRTISALGMLGDSRAVEPLIALLDGEEEVIATSAILSLGLIGDTRAIEPLLSILENKSGLRQESAMEALGQIGDIRAVEPLIAILEGEDEYSVMNAGMALAQIGDQRAVEPIRAAIERVGDGFVKTKLKEAYKTLTGEDYPG